MKAIPNIFVCICNCSLATGKFPLACKTDRLTFIPKKEMFVILIILIRPISILPILGKILEKHVKGEIIVHFEKYGLFYEYQFGLGVTGPVLMLFFMFYIIFIGEKRRRVQQYDFSRSF